LSADEPIVDLPLRHAPVMGFAALNPFYKNDETGARAAVRAGPNRGP